MPNSDERPLGRQASLPAFLRIASIGPAFHGFLHSSIAAILVSLDFLIILKKSPLLRAFFVSHFPEYYVRWPFITSTPYDIT